MKRASFVLLSHSCLSVCLQYECVGRSILHVYTAAALALCRATTLFQRVCVVSLIMDGRGQSLHRIM